MANTKVTGDLIASSTIATGNIADNAVTSDKISGITTAHITEGSNLYYTDARADARITAATTSDLSEGTNLYYTDARADARAALLVDSAPSTLNTLNELAAALGDDPNFATTVTNSIGLKAPLASPSFTGNATFAGALNVNGNATLATYSGTGENYTILAQNDYGQMRAGIRSGVPYIGSISSLPLDIYTGNSSKIRIETSGLVSLPTTGLNDTRHIIFTGTQGTANNAGNLGMWGNEVRLTSNWYYNGAQQKVVAGNGMGVMAIGTGTTDASCYLSFGINGPAATGGPTERMRISSSGNVGIGFAAGHDATTKLELPGSLTNSSLKVGTVETQSYSVNNAWVADNVYYDGAFKLRSAGYASQIYFGNSNGGADISFKRYPNGNAGSVATGVISLQLLGDGDVYIPGNVGIGTASPSAQLHLYNAAASGTPMLQVMSHATAAGSFTGNYMAEFCHAFSGVNHGMLIKNNEASDGRNTLDVADANGVFATFVNGKVGIGTTSPANKLNVNGDIGFTGVIGQGSIYGNTANNSYANMQLYNPATGYSTFNNQTYGYYFNTAGGTKVTILNNGRVGIGTTSPSEILHVNKNATSRIVGAYFTNSQANTGAEAVSIAFGLNRSGGDFVRKVEAIEFGALQQWTGTPSTVNSYLAFNVTKSESLYERMRVTTNGIDVTSWGAHGVHLKPDTADTNNSGRLFLTRIGGSGWAVMNNSTNFSIRSGAQVDSTSGTEKIRLTGYSATSWTSGSDETIKENIKPIGNVLDKINDYRCVEYNLIDDETKDKKIGFIAQDWQEDFPQIIEQMENEKIGMKYTETIPILLKAIQELKAEIEILKNK